MPRAALGKSDNGGSGGVLNVNHADFVNRMVEPVGKDIIIKQQMLQ